MESREIRSVRRWGIVGVLSTVLLTFSGHWCVKAVAGERAELANYRVHAIHRSEEKQPIKNRTYSLEIRGAGIGIHQDYQSTIWEFIKIQMIIKLHFRLERVQAELKYVRPFSTRQVKR